MAVFDWFIGTAQQSVLFLTLKIVVCTISCLVMMTSSSIRNVNKNSLNNNQLGRALGWLSLTIFSSLLILLVLIGNLDSLINTSHNSNLSGIIFFGTWIIFGLGWTIIAWSVLLMTLKKSLKSATEKEGLPLNNNLTFGIGIMGLMLGMVGVIMMVTVIFVSTTPPAQKSIEFHPVRLLGSILTFSIPMYLLVKIPKWFRRYVEKFI